MARVVQADEEFRRTDPDKGSGRRGLRAQDTGAAQAGHKESACVNLRSYRRRRQIALTSEVTAEGGKLRVNLRSYRRRRQIALTSKISNLLTKFQINLQISNLPPTFQITVTPKISNLPPKFQINPQNFKFTSKICSQTPALKKNSASSVRRACCSLRTLSRRTRL